jgi:ABC-type multidrug transport system permease subunit
LLGKQIPYIGVAMANFALMFLMALFVFQVPLKGSFLTLLLGVLIYVTTTTGELCAEVGWGCSTPPLLHQRSDTP